MFSFSPQTLALFQKIGAFATRYIIIIGVALFCGLAAFLIIQTTHLTTKEPSQGKLDAKLQSTSTPRISDETATIIERLGTQDITVESNLGSERDNPFAE